MFGAAETTFTSGVLIADILLIITEASRIKEDSEHSHSWIYLFFRPELSVDYLLRIVIAFVLLLCTYIILSIRIHKKTPITILRTEINISINEDFSFSNSRKVQTIRANIPNVTAYFSSSKPAAPNGRCQNIHMSAHCEGAPNMADSTEFRHQHTGGFEAIHYFGRPLRYRFYMLLFPKSFYSGSYNQVLRFFRKNLTERSQELTYVNEHNVPQPIIEFAAIEYVQHNITIVIDFGHHTPESLKIRKIALHGVVDLPFSRPTQKRICVFVSRLYKERIRISWENSAALVIAGQAAADMPIAVTPARLAPPSA